MPPGLKNKAKVVCPACGAHTDLGRHFCGKCGLPILSGNLAPQRILARKESGGPLSALRNVLLAFFLVWIAGSLALIAWPFEAFGVVGSEAQADEAARVILVLRNGVEAGGISSTQVVTEAGFNAWAARNLAEGKDLRVQSGPSQISAVATEHFLGLPVSTRVVMTRGRPDQPFAVKTFWWGHLPMPRGAAGWMTRSLAQRFGLDFPAAFWRDLRIVEADRQRIFIGGVTEKLP